MRTSTPLLITLGAFTLFLAGCSDQQAEMRSAFAGVCAGQGASRAAAYEGGGVHPIVLLASNGESHTWSNDLPGEWIPGSAEEAQLVACVEEEVESSIEVCQYNGPDITRYRYEVRVRLVEARTGVQVASTRLQGSEPRECQSTEDYDLTRLAGDHVSFSAAADWLRAHVEMAAVSAGTAPEPAGPAPNVQSPSGASEAPFVGEWQATDSYDGSAMRLTITGDAADGYVVVWDDEYWSLCEGDATVETTGSIDAGDPNILHTFWVVGCTVPGQVGEFAADFRYSEANASLEQIYEDGSRDTWYRASSTSISQPPEEVSVYCGEYGESPVSLDHSRLLTLYWTWGAASEAYQQVYADAALFSLRLDGDLIDVSRASQSMEECDYGACATWRLPPMALEEGAHEAVMTVTLGGQITDGLDLDQDGALDLYGPGEFEAPPCVILVE